MTTQWVRSALRSRYGGSMSHTMDRITERSLCGRFSGSETTLNFRFVNNEPTCKKCLNRDHRFTVQTVKA